MNGSASPAGNASPVEGCPKHDQAIHATANGQKSPRAAQSLATENAKAVVDEQTSIDQNEQMANASALSEEKSAALVNGIDEGGESEAETLISTPVKKKEAQKLKNGRAIVVEKPTRSRIGSLPVPSGEDDEESESIATPVQSTELDIKTGSCKNGDEMDAGSDKESSTDSLSSARSSASDLVSRSSSRTRALSERPEFGRNGPESPNPRKRKHRASSASLPNKRQSMEPPKRKLRGMHSEDNVVRIGQSPSPKARSHRRAVSTQSTLADSAAEGSNRKRRSTNHLPVRDLKSSKGPWEESDASSETTSHGQVDSRRSQRGVGRSTSTPSRPAGREQKRHVNKYGFTRLAEACESGDMDLVREWRERDPDQIELAEFAGNKPLQIAALNGNDEVVRYLIDQGCQIDCANVDKDTPLIDAAENGHLQVVKLLLDAGVDPLRQNLKGQQALDVVTDDTNDVDAIRAALREAIERWNSNDAKQRREEEEEQRHRAGPSKELHFMARTYENLQRLVKINDRNGVREFLDARVPVDNGIIADAAKTGDQYLVNMLLAEMTEKKLYQKAEKPMLAVLGTSHFDMVQMLTSLDQFNPLYTNRAGKNWLEIAEERNGPHMRQEKELLQRLIHERTKALGRRSSSPVTKREHGKRRPVHEATDEDSDEEDAPKRKVSRRLMSRKDIRAASGKSVYESESDDVHQSTSEDARAETEATEVMKPPECPTRRRAAGRTRTKSISSQPSIETSPRTKRRSSSLRGIQEKVLPTLEETAAVEEKEVEKKRKQEEATAAEETRRLEAKRTEEEEAAAAAAKQMEEAAARKAEEERKAEAERQAEEERQAEDERKAEAERQAEEERKAEAERQAEERKAEEQRQQREVEERTRRAEEEARRAEAARMAEERRQREIQLQNARSIYRQKVLASLPTPLKYALDPEASDRYEGKAAMAFIIENFTPLVIVREDFDGPWVLNLQAAALLGKRGLELLLPRNYDLEFEMTFTRDWPIIRDLSHHEMQRVRQAIDTLTRRERPVDDDKTMEFEVDFGNELARTAARVNAIEAAKKRLNDSLVSQYCVRLQDILAYLDPLLKDAPIEMQFPTEHTKKFGSNGLTNGLTTAGLGFRGNRKVLQMYRAGSMVQAESTRVEGLTGRTKVVVVHEK